jgi:hypothetical protein
VWEQTTGKRTFTRANGDKRKDKAYVFYPKRLKAHLYPKGHGGKEEVALRQHNTKSAQVRQIEERNQQYDQDEDLFEPDTTPRSYRPSRAANHVTLPKRPPIDIQEAAFNSVTSVVGDANVHPHVKSTVVRYVAKLMLEGIYNTDGELLKDPRATERDPNNTLGFATNVNDLLRPAAEDDGSSDEFLKQASTFVLDAQRKDGDEEDDDEEEDTLLPSLTLRTNRPSSTPNLDEGSSAARHGSTSSEDDVEEVEEEAVAAPDPKRARVD